LEQVFRSYWLNPHALPVALAALTAVMTAVVAVARERGSRESVHLLQLALAALVWLGSTACVYCARTPEVADAWARTAYLGIPLIPPAMIAFTFSVLRIKRLRFVLWASAGLGCALLVLCQRGGLVIGDVVRYWWGYRSLYGPLGVVMVLFHAATLVFCTALFLRDLRAAPKGSARWHRSRHLCIGFASVCLAVVDFFASYGIAVYPFGFAVVVVFIALLARAVDRYRLVDLTPAFAAEEVLATMQGAVVVADAEGEIQLANRAAQELLGRREHELRGTRLAEVLEAGEAPYRERLMVWQNRAGESIDVTVSATTLHDPRGVRVGVVYVAADVSARRRAEQRLKALNGTLEQRVGERSADLEKRARALEWALDDRHHAEEELRRAYEELRATQRQLVHSEKIAAIGQLAAGVAHEINNPIAYVLSNLESLRPLVEELVRTVGEYERLAAAVLAGDREGLKELERLRASSSEQGALAYLSRELPEMLSDMLDGVERVRTIVANLRSFARRETEWQEVDLRAQLERALALVSNELKYTCAVETELGPLPLVRGNANELVQVFVNLLLNAHQAIEGSGTIRISGRSTADEVTLRIEDSGCGIPETMLKRIFEPFYTTKEATKGTGLGLSIVHRILESHGGRIEVESTVGVGSRFTLHLPIAPGGQRDAREPSSRALCG